MKRPTRNLLLSLFLAASTAAGSAANVTVYDSVVSLATNGAKNYMFTDASSGQSVVVAVTLSPYSPVNPKPTFQALDGDTRVGMDFGNGFNGGRGVNFAATLVSTSSGVTEGTIQFRISGLGVRPVQGGGDFTWSSSASSSSGSYVNSTEFLQSLDTSLMSLSSASYAGQLRFPSDALMQLSDAGTLAGQSVVLNAVFTATAADARTNSWLTTYSGRYARIYASDVNKTNGVTATTWSNGAQTQSLPTYSGVQEIYSSSNWVYIRTTGLGSHTMGPWYDNAARTTAFVNMPVNQKAFYRFPRTPAVPGNKTTTGGELGYMIDGVKLFDSRDAVSYINSTGQDGSPPGGGGSQGDGIWNRDAYMNEATTFDPSLAHQQNTGVYHYHASPLALRYLLGDNVNFNPTNKLYTPNTNVPTKHSPIIAWANDGFPIYGPYGYSSASNSGSGVRRMISGFVLRNGQFGTTNLNVTGRTSLAPWAQRAQGKTTLTASQYGPSVSVNFPMGRYVEDNDYLGDLGYTQGGGTFDLDEFNGRWCVTPEFPLGTYAYFNVIDASGNPAYPYNIGRQYYGSPTAGTVTALAETVVTNFVGGPGMRESMNSLKRTGSTVVLTWSAVEGGTYRVEASTNLSTWTTNITGIGAVLDTGSSTNTSTEGTKFFRVNRSAIATYDPVSGTTGGGGAATITMSPNSHAANGVSFSVTATISSTATPSVPPQSGAPVASFTVGNLSVTGATYTYSGGSGIVTGTLNVLGGTAAGAKTVTITFSPPPGQTNGPSYTQLNGFTVN